MDRIRLRGVCLGSTETQKKLKKKNLSFVVFHCVIINTWFMLMYLKIGWLIGSLYIMLSMNNIH